MSTSFSERESLFLVRSGRDSTGVFTNLWICDGQKKTRSPSSSYSFSISCSHCVQTQKKPRQVGTGTGKVGDQRKKNLCKETQKRGGEGDGTGSLNRCVGTPRAGRDEQGGCVWRAKRGRRPGGLRKKGGESLFKHLYVKTPKKEQHAWSTGRACMGEKRGCVVFKAKTTKRRNGKKRREKEGRRGGGDWCLDPRAPSPLLPLSRLTAARAAAHS